MPNLKRRRLGVTVLLAAGMTGSLSWPCNAAAQDTRAEVIQQQQEGKQQRLEPPQPSGAERFIARLEDWGLIVGTPRGLYPWFGSVYSGGGLAAGAGVRKPFADDGAFNVFGGYSLGSFARAQADLELPTFAANRARITLSGRYIDAPAVRYFGIGNDSRKEDETRFGHTPADASVRLDFRAGKYLSLGGGVTFLDVETTAGRTAPSIEERFSPADAPGIGTPGFTYINSSIHAAVDWRSSLGYRGQGGLYRVRFDDYRERRNDAYSFTSLEAEVVQLVPILRANWVIALRGVATATDIDDTSVVPYFLLPSIGGGSTLRGYPDFRFRDRNRVVLNAELRWTPARFMDMAVFYDAGKVAYRRMDLDLDNLKTSYGVGMRIIGMEGYALRIEVARSREHSARLIFGVGGTF